MTASRPTKILIVDTAIAFGGTLVVSRNLLKHLDPSKVNASLVSACADGFVSEQFAGSSEVRLLAPRIDYATLGKWKHAIQTRCQWSFISRGLKLLVMGAEILGNLPYLVRLIHLYYSMRLDLVHVNNYTMEPLWAARLLHIPIVYHLHGIVSNPMDGSGKRNFRHVRAFVSISNTVTNSAVRAGIDRARIHEIPNFVEQVPETPAPPMPIEPTIGIFGRVTQWKGQKEFLRAAINLLPRFPGLHVYVVGGSADTDPRYFDECLAIAHASPYSTQIKFTGLVTNVVDYYRRCSIVVHASIEPEPFGMVLIEAMAQARPVVASIFGAASEIVSEGVDGFLVNPQDTHALTARIAELLSDPKLATNMGLNGHEKVQTRYGPSTAARRFERLYDEISSKQITS